MSRKTNRAKKWAIKEKNLHRRQEISFIVRKIQKDKVVDFKRLTTIHDVEYFEGNDGRFSLTFELGTEDSFGLAREAFSLATSLDLSTYLWVGLTTEQCSDGVRLPREVVEFIATTRVDVEFSVVSF